MKKTIAILASVWLPALLSADPAPTNNLAVVTTPAEELAFIRAADRIDIVPDPHHAESVLTIRDPAVIRELTTQVTLERGGPRPCPPHPWLSFWMGTNQVTVFVDHTCFNIAHRDTSGKWAIDYYDMPAGFWKTLSDPEFKTRANQTMEGTK